VTTVAVYSPRNAQRVLELLERSGHELLLASDQELSGTQGAIVDATADLDQAVAWARALRKRRGGSCPVLLMIDRHQVRDLALRDGSFDDFAVSPFDKDELAMRLAHLLHRARAEEPHSVIAYGPLLLDLDTYQALIDGRPLDLTYMEYELLKFLAGHPGKVFSRETLLSRVWGYEYFGGARTVDVHIRRLRAKLGEAHEHLIQTVRSVGYRFGTPGQRP